MSSANLNRQLLQLLADGHFHSGTELAERLGIGRTSVWKQLQDLEPLGLEVIGVTGKGYRLQQPLQLLERQHIVSRLSKPAEALIRELQIHDQIDSTNAHLLAQALREDRGGVVCLAEYQRAGKGRRGKAWVSPFGRNIYLSLSWRYQGGPSLLAGLSLAVGVGVIRVLRQLGLLEAGLKWPNDIYCRDRKLAGILIEVSGESGGPCHAVVGLGLNLSLSANDGAMIDQAWTDWQRLAANGVPDRNQLVAMLLNQLLPIVAEYEATGLADFLPEWRDYDCLQGRQALVTIAEQRIEGIVRGIDDQGLLQLELGDGQSRSFASGEVSLKLQ